MTKKDYELIAATIAWVTQRSDRRLVAEGFADALQADNPRFDRGRFLAACGVL